MKTVVIHYPHILTKLEIWSPRYKDKSAEGKESYVALLAKYKVDAASPLILVEFTKAKHLQGQRFCIKKEDAMSYPVESNTKIPVYAVPLDAFDTWETKHEQYNKAMEAFDH